jgi:hypothetical protein
LNGDRREHYRLVRSFRHVIVIAFICVRMAAKNQEEGLHDTGLAIIEFNRAFPNEAIRQLQATANGQAVFVRLHDNKAGSCAICSDTMPATSSSRAGCAYEF